MARKPLAEKTVAENCLKYGTGGINIDGCRVGTGDDRVGGGLAKENFGINGMPQTERPSGARFPANLILSWNSDEYMLKLDVSVDDLIKLKKHYERP